MAALAKGKHTRLCSNNTGSCFVQLSRWIFQGFAIWHKNSLHRDASDTSVKYINQNDGSSEYPQLCCTLEKKREISG